MILKSNRLIENDPERKEGLSTFFHVPINFLIMSEIHFEFEREMLASQDTVHFLDCLQPRPDASKVDVRNLFGRIVFSFKPLELDGDIWTYPEVREYISKLNEIWPCWLYYSVPNYEVLLPIMACLCSNVWSAYDSETDQTTIVLPYDQTLPVFLAWMGNALKIADWAGVPQRAISHRLHDWMQMLLPPEVAEDFKRKVRDFE